MAHDSLVNSPVSDLKTNFKNIEKDRNGTVKYKLA